MKILNYGLVKIIGDRPTALNKRGNKINAGGYTFDSTKEYKFWNEFIKDSGFNYDVHPKFDLLESFEVDKGIKLRSVSYKPDFVIRNGSGKIVHVYDVKNGFSVYAVDTSVQLRFKMFAKQQGMPVEAVVVRAHDFRTKVFGTTKHYDPQIRHTLYYDWWELG